MITKNERKNGLKNDDNACALMSASCPKRKTRNENYTVGLACLFI